ncbi:MAG: TRAP transporter large permease subunit [Candidatus Azotimanducaceae bacterium]
MNAAPLAMFLTTFIALIAGYPVALTLAGVALIFALIGSIFGSFNPSDLGFAAGRLFGLVTNQTLIAIPLFVFMGVTLEKTKIAETLLSDLSNLFGRSQSGLAVTVILVGALMAASTGIVGATVVTMSLMALPVMLNAGYDARLAAGTISATGTLGQIIPPSIALVLLGDVLSNAYQQAQLNQGIFAPKSVSVGDLFAGAIVPGLCLVVLYLLYVYTNLLFSKNKIDSKQSSDQKFSVFSLLLSLSPPLLLIFAVLGSIILGYATPTEAAGIGAAGAILIGLVTKRLEFSTIKAISESTLSTTGMVFFILIGASIFSLVFRGFGGDEQIQSVFDAMPGGVTTALIVVMVVIFLLGFILDFIEITFVVVPIVGPVLLAMGVDPIWLGVVIAINLQTSFLTPPFGFALFYLRGVAPANVETKDIYLGAVPFVGLQILILILLFIYPSIATWLPTKLYG